MSVHSGGTADRAAVNQSMTVSSVRQRNRALVLKHLVVEGRTTRAELAQVTGLSAASATNLVTELMADGLLIETGHQASQGGRPITLLEPRPEGAYFIGADVGERGVAVELFDLAMNRVDREFRGGREDEQPETIGQDLTAAIAAIRDRNLEAWARLGGVGVGLPGIVETDATGEQILYAQSLHWSATPVRSLVALDVPLFADNGAKAEAKAETWFGAARGIEHALVVLMGRGVGLGVVSAGELQRGVAGSSSEWGHVTIQRGGRQCRCGNRGCVEAYLGADGMLAAWSEAGGTFEGSGWRAIGELFDADRAGDPTAVAVVEEIVQTLGSALGSLVNLNNPERIVIGGWVGLRVMESLADRIEAATRAASLDRPGSQFELVPTTFGGDTVSLGAAVMPLERLIYSPR